MSIMYDNTGKGIGNNNPLPMRSIQQRWRAGFTGTELNPNKWEVIQVGAGQSYSVNNGTLQINAGTTANSETIIRSLVDFDVPYRAMMNIGLSQRIANQEIYFEMVSVDRESGEVNSHSLAGWMFDGTSATQAKYTVNGGDQPILVSTASTVTSTALPGGIYEIEPTTDECWFFSRAIDSTNGRAQSFVRHSQIPSSVLRYKLQIRVKNLAVAPASNTVVSSQFANISDYSEITAEITAGRGSAVAGQGIYATVGGSLSAVTTVSTAYTVPKIVFASETVANIPVATPFTGTAKDTGSTPAHSIMRIRAYANQPLRLDVYCGSSATLTSNRIQQVITVPADTVTIVDVPICARYIGIKATNTGSATTTTVEILSVLMS